MSEREIWHEIHIKAAPAKVFEAVADRAHLAKWFTTDTRGEAAVGKSLEFWFNGQRAAEMVVTALKADEEVRWRVTERSVADWVGTEVAFTIFPGDGKTVLHLRHAKWREDAEMFPECSMHWAIYLLSLKEFVETGKGRPHPYDMPVNI